MKWAAVVIVIIAFPLPASADAAAFDLHCLGTSDSFAYNGESSSMDFEATFRIDLDRNIWCRDECKDIGEIARVSAGTIVFQEKPSYQEEGLDIFVNRVTGEYHEAFITDVLKAYTKATCERMPFSGIPDLKV